MNVWGSTTSGLFLAPAVAVGGRTGAAEGGRTGPVNHTAEIRAERFDRREHMTEYAHRVEVFVEDAFDGSGRGWGWQCFTPGCGKEETGWATYAEAEADAEVHREAS